MGQCAIIFGCSTLLTVIFIRDTALVDASVTVELLRGRDVHPVDPSEVPYVNRFRHTRHVHARSVHGACMVRGLVEGRQGG